MFMYKQLNCDHFQSSLSQQINHLKIQRRFIVKVSKYAIAGNKPLNIFEIHNDNLLQKIKCAIAAKRICAKFFPLKKSINKQLK